MGKSNAKRSRNNFVRGVRAESALRAYTTALGYIETRQPAQAMELIDKQIKFFRKELSECSKKREAVTDGHE